MALICLEIQQNVVLTISPTAINRFKLSTSSFEPIKLVNPVREFLQNPSTSGTSRVGSKWHSHSLED